MVMTWGHGFSMAQGVHPSFKRSFRIRAVEDAVISREGLRNLTVEGQSASLALLGMMLGIGARAAMAGFLEWRNGKMMKNGDLTRNLESGRKIPKQKGWLVGWWTEKHGDLTWFKHLKWGYYGDVTNMNHWLVVWNIYFPLSYFQGVVTANVRTPFMKTLVWQMRVDVDLTVDIGLFGASIWLCLNM